LAFIQLRAAFLDMTYLPVRLMPVVRHVRPHGVLAGPGALFRSELIGVIFMLIPILVPLTAAALLFRCGPTIDRFLSGHSESGNTADPGSSII
jgi:hypothetical protein